MEKALFPILLVLTMLTHTPELDFAVVILSSPDIKKGEIYTISVGSNSGEYTAD